MKQTKMCVIAVLAIAGVLLLLSEPSEGMDWFAGMFWKSMFGLGCWGVCALLYSHWGCDYE